MARATLPPIAADAPPEAPAAAPSAPEPDPAVSFVTNNGQQQHRIAGRWFGPRSSLRIQGKPPGPWRVVDGPPVAEHEVRALARAVARGAMTCVGPALDFPAEDTKPALSAAELSW